MMLCVLLEIVQGLQCTMSLLSYAAPLDERTVASSGMKSKWLMLDKEIIGLKIQYIQLEGFISFLPCKECYG